ncbi:hypothetical protein BJX62DRAFT_243179 [Aspergillus germanicus]
MPIDSQSYTSYDIFEPLDLVEKLQALESVALNGITDHHAEADPVPRSSAKYSRISIQHSCLSPNGLCGAIESATRLEELVYSIGGRDSPDGLHSMVDLYAYLTSLLMHKDSIERLDLSVDANLSFKELLKAAGEDSVLASPVECTLKLFDKLKHLALGAHTLYYYTPETNKDQAEIPSIADGLPLNLESLRIYGYRKGNSSMARWELPHLDLDTHVSRFMEERESI